jgi:3-hydroxy-9,10-secoandrosta-1,3,5(10)-triene-9,17-dione monooxygenase reductase component
MPASAAAAPAPAPAPAARAFRRALGRFATGVTLITAPGGESLVVNAFMSVSLDPPLVAFCAGRSSLTWQRMRRSGRLGINVLDSSMDDVRDRARPGADRLAGLDVRFGPHGAPRLASAVAFLLVEVVEERAVGDHALVTCAVREADCDGDRRPLVFFGGAFGSFAA